ncbi:2-dehydro-3-deoxygalactonokinase [Leisingera sp. MMG026]|uniref:2-dehydro-3-deoxygalactonokinase n=1 Tax=Leisingera sp. MMG026 TaxID=2909982 RepID=UPI001F3C8E58|nr:2-dehydro-3-deoxygalactonokinase [Leisingera sp. MMG026]MCF6432740.1 2-dehydro-3-deoxygalactonokinase [Leisingera sp. MMG026]
MQSPRNGTGWLAANLDGDTLSAWEMAGSTAGPAQMLRLQDSRPPALAAALRQVLGGAPRPVLLGGTALAPPHPVPVQPAKLPVAKTVLDGMPVHVLPGLSQTAPCGLMQGAAAAVSGFLQLNPEWDGVICLPGIVTHWVQISAREAVSFQSALTAQLAQVAIRGMALEAAGTWDKAVLAEAVADGIAKPEQLAARLASVQAAAALGQLPDEAARAQIWGHLLGAELAAARPYWLGQNLALIADPTLQAFYAAALDAQALPVTLADPGRMTLQGLIGAWPG